MTQAASSTSGTQVLSDGTTAPARAPHPLDALHPSRVPPRPPRLRRTELALGERLLYAVAGGLAVLTAWRRGGTFGVIGGTVGALFLARAGLGRRTGFTRAVNRLLLRF